MDNMFKKGQVALVRLCSGDDPMRLFSLMLALYLGISAGTVPSSTASCCEDGAAATATSSRITPIRSNLTLDAEPVIGLTALPTDLQPPAPRWVF